MATFDWVEAAEFACQRYERDDWSLARLVSDLEHIVVDAGTVEGGQIRVLRATWFKLEILNALELAGDRAADPAEIDELLADFVSQVKRAAGGLIT